MTTTSAGEPFQTIKATHTMRDIKDLSAEADPEGGVPKEALGQENKVTQGAPVGVQQAEAVALVWSKTTVYTVYAW